MLEKIGYSILEDINDKDIEICESLENDFTDEYICDAINEVCNDYYDRYYLFEYAELLYTNDYIEDAQINGLYEGNDLVSMLEWGYYCYIQRLLYKNLEDIATNIAINYINENNIPITEFDFDDTFNGFKGIDNNSRISYITDLVDDYMCDKKYDMINDLGEKIKDKEITIKELDNIVLEHLKEFDENYNGDINSILTKNIEEVIDSEFVDYNIYEGILNIQFEVIDKKDILSDTVVQVYEVEEI